MELCCSPLRVWMGLTHRAEDAVSQRLAKLAKQCALHPKKSLLIALLLCLACAVGFVRFELKSDGDELWTDQHSEPMNNRRYV
eukprot:CAMPEP_0178402306 /NCGR_PEP_ID=MMETSP0689_2-20121128/16768_1 /TAXON_ID=160604 /ORGANISM="Amphidinium massartii, Strain CS-259" /LENGTH=82 /DNA_ID=CAMNT_0020023191 /DNA_START=117 /DNA_END=362 /DNA_ORIENTATION=+